MKQYDELFCLMKYFWKRLNHVKVDTIFLEQRKADLTKKYEKIREQLEDKLMNITYSRTTIHARVDSVKRLDNLTVNCVKEITVKSAVPLLRNRRSNKNKEELKINRRGRSVPNYIQRSSLIQRLTKVTPKTTKNTEIIK